MTSSSPSKTGKQSGSARATTAKKVVYLPTTARQPAYQTRAPRSSTFRSSWTPPSTLQILRRQRQAPTPRRPRTSVCLSRTASTMRRWTAPRGCTRRTGMPSRRRASYLRNGTGTCCHRVVLHRSSSSSNCARISVSTRCNLPTLSSSVAFSRSSRLASLRRTSLMRRAGRSSVRILGRTCVVCRCVSPAACDVCFLILFRSRSTPQCIFATFIDTFVSTFIPTTPTSTTAPSPSFAFMASHISSNGSGTCGRKRAEARPGRT